jgi:hypothetical protein
MVRWPAKRCIVKGCRQFALYGLHTRERCETHKEPGEFNLVEAPCITCGLIAVLSDTKRCSTCEPETTKKYTKRKETRVRNLLELHHIMFHSHDTIIDHGVWGKERPDFVIHCGTHILILEVDEDQHKSYKREREMLRMKKISHFFGGLPVFWIRYNPDSFKASEKMKPAQREACLIKWVQWAIGYVPKAFAEVIYLCYDGCKIAPTQEDIKVLLMERQ